MRTEVLAGFPAFTKRFEGLTTWFYLDIRGLVTIGIGNLVDPYGDALALDYSPSAPLEVYAAWKLVKSRQDLRTMGGGAFEKLTTVRATPESIDKLVRSKMLAMEAILIESFPDWDCWPGNAQTAVLSMSWAMGPKFTVHYPKFVAACRAQDWATAAVESYMQDGDNPGLRPRNRANRQLFLDCC